MTSLTVVKQDRIFELADGTLVRIRPIRHADEARMVEFHGTLSDHTVYMRYFHLMGLPFRISHERLANVCRFDPDTQLVFIAEVGIDHDSRIIAVGRLAPRDLEPHEPPTPGQAPVHDETEFALVIADDYQNRGIGRRLLEHLVEVSRWLGAKRITADILPDNHAMIHLSERAGFNLHWDHAENTIRATKTLREWPC